MVKDNGRGWERSADYYDSRFATDIRNATQYTKEVTDWTPVWEWIANRVQGQRILDVGCGLGHLCKILSERGRAVTGLDFSKVAIENARQRAPKADFICVDILENLGILKTTEYDTVIFSEFLEHITNDLLVVGSVPVGKEVFLSVPPYDSDGHVRWFESLDDVKNRYSPFITITAGEVVTRFNFYCLRGIRC